DGAQADGPGGARSPSDPGRRRTPGFISGPRITPPARRASKPSVPAAQTAQAGPAVQPAPEPRTEMGGPRHAKPPTRPPTVAKKKRTGLWIGIGALATALIAAGGLYAGGAFEEEPAPAPRVRTAAPVATPPPPPVEEKAPEPVKA